MTGATSQDLYSGMGKPIQGQEAREIKKPHGAHNKKPRTGVAGRGGVEGVEFMPAKGPDLPKGQDLLEGHGEQGERGTSSD